MSVIKITSENFEALSSSERPLLVDFYADWCGPCRMMGPTIDEIAKERDDIAVGKVNVDTERELATRFGIVSIPTLVVLKDGKTVAKSTGLKPKDAILAMLNS